MKKKGKENVQKNNENVQKRERNMSIKEEKKPSEIDPKKATFFIPLNTTPRERSITPKEAREHSFRKWKELP